jgi:hypothetical protein
MVYRVAMILVYWKNLLVESGQASTRVGDCWKIACKLARMKQGGSEQAARMTPYRRPFFLAATGRSKRAIEWRVRVAERRRRCLKKRHVDVGGLYNDEIRPLLPLLPKVIVRSLLISK